VHWTGQRSSEEKGDIVRSSEGTT